MKCFFLTMLTLFSTLSISQKEYEDLHNVSNEARQILDSSYWVCLEDSSMIQINIKVNQKKMRKYSTTIAWVKNLYTSGFGSERLHGVKTSGDSTILMNGFGINDIILLHGDSIRVIICANRKYNSVERKEFELILNDRRRRYREKYPISEPPSGIDY